MKLLKKASFIDILLIASPIIDVIICMLQKFTNISLLGTLIRGCILVGILIYILFIKKEYNKKTINYIIVLFLYAFAFVFSSFLINKKIIIDEYIGLIKYLFYPLMVACLLSIDDSDDKRTYNALYISGLIYALFLLLPMLFNVNFKSYSSIKVGNIGWFFSANEISSIVSILCPFILIKIFNAKSIKLKILQTIISSIFIFTIFTIGTKTVIASVFITLFFLFINSIYSLIKKHNNANILLLIVLIAFSVYCFSNSSSLQNIKTQSETFTISDIAKRDADVVSSTSTDEVMKNHYDIMYNFRDEPIYITNKYLNLIFSSRDVFLMEHISSYKKAGIQEKLLGMGQIYNEKSSATSKLVEIDFFDIFFNYGIIGFIVYFSFITYLLFMLIKHLFCNLKETFDNQDLYASYISIGITFVLSCVSGHIIGAPAVSLIAAIIIAGVGRKIINQNLIHEKIFNKRFIDKIIICLIVIVCFVLGINNVSKAKDIGSVINVTVNDGNMVITDNSYEIKQTKTEEIKSDYAIDKLSYYKVFYNNKSIIKLLLVNRSFLDSNITYTFLIGKNYTKYNILLNVNSENGYLSSNVYDLINVNYDGLNHSIIKDLVKSNDYSNINEILLGDDQYFDALIINNIESATIYYDELFNDSWLSFDGRYSKSNLKTIPQGNNTYVRNSYNEIENYILNKYKDTNNEVYKSLVYSYLHSLINYLPRYKDSIWLTEYTIDELNNYGIKSFYVNTSDNIGIANYLRLFNDNKIIEMNELLAEYITNKNALNYTLTTNNGDLPLDYYNNSLKNSYSTLEMNIKLISYLLNCSNKDYQKLGLSYVNSINSNWINDNNNLYIRIDDTLNYTGNDEGISLLEQLLDLQNLIIKKTGKKSKNITTLIKTKVTYLDSIGYNFDSNLLKELKVGGYVE